MPEALVDKLIVLTRSYADSIQNGRTAADVYRHLGLEAAELADEIRDEGGEDGIAGESIDLITCGLDLIFVYDPSTTNAEISSMMRQRFLQLYNEGQDDPETSFAYKLLQQELMKLEECWESKTDIVHAAASTTTAALYLVGAASELTDVDIIAYATKKLDKWKENYSDSIESKAKMSGI